MCGQVSLVVMIELKMMILGLYAVVVVESNLLLTFGP